MTLYLWIAVVFFAAHLALDLQMLSEDGVDGPGAVCAALDGGMLMGALLLLCGVAA